MGKNAQLFWASYRTIRRQFGQVYVLSQELAAGRKDPKGNVIVLATLSADPVDPETLLRNAQGLAVRWRLSRMARYASSVLHGAEEPEGIPELTDRYAPVEALQHF